MNKVITINLNGRAYQIEESGYEALRMYLEEASSRLASDPSKSEIVADLEQAIAEKCDKVLSPHKSVVLTDEITKILAEMGPVEGDAQKESSEQASSGSSHTHKRLFLMRQGAVFAGVCAGLAAYFDIDVTIVRIIFIAGTVFTSGLGILIYVALAILVPYADTAEAMAQARGEVLNAHTLVQRAKERFEETFERVSGHKMDWGDSDEHNKDDWKRRKREMKQQWKAQWRMQRYHSNPGFGFLRAVLALVWILALISLVTTGAIFGWLIPAGIPLWVSIIALFVIYHAVTGPIKGAQYSASWSGAPGQTGYQYGYQSSYSPWDGLVDGLTVLFLIIAFIWAYQHVPQVYTFIHHPIAESKILFGEVKNWWHTL